MCVRTKVDVFDLVFQIRLSYYSVSLERMYRAGMLRTGSLLIWEDRYLESWSPQWILQTFFFSQGTPQACWEAACQEAGMGWVGRLEGSVASSLPGREKNLSVPHKSLCAFSGLFHSCAACYTGCYYSSASASAATDFLLASWLKCVHLTQEHVYVLWAQVYIILMPVPSACAPKPLLHQHDQGSRW